MSDWERAVTIVCPSCSATQKATEVCHPGDPFPTYIHECDQCAYIITESEWEYAEEKSVSDECCRDCQHWRRSLPKQKHGWCYAWSPADYHQRYGHGGSRFLGYRGHWVSADEGDWCARFRLKNARKDKP